MDWILNKKRISNTDLKKKKKSRKNYSKPSLRYCIDCKKVWVISTTGSILFYDHLPTYGLERRTCKACDNRSTETYEHQRRTK